MLPSSLLPLIEDLKTVPGIRAIVLGGSRARGSGDASSDTDLGLYYDPESPLDIVALNQVAARRDDRKEVDLVTSIGGWGPWINGGGWLRVDGSAVDLLYRDTSKVGSVIDNCVAGHVEVAYQPGHPLGFLSSIYAGEVAVCQTLWDPTAWMTSSKNRLVEYPEALRRELVRRFGFEAGFCLLIGVRPDPPLRRLRRHARHHHRADGSALWHSGSDFCRGLRLPDDRGRGQYGHSDDPERDTGGADRTARRGADRCDQ
jgi:predicted nucleotidyltransferase